MNPFEFAALIVTISIIAGTITKITSLIINRRRDVAAPGQLDRIEERLARMEQALDAVSMEVERVSEGQRFTTKLLADRSREAVQGD